ncbi:hypothetical protein B0H14DRAFT_2635718 [Mycena olivaceomarginata]|nr:hypothetical protein B0H14DRAFT_2635718 [Mycena olivaceomarginata]
MSEQAEGGNARPYVSPSIRGLIKVLAVLANVHLVPVEATVEYPAHWGSPDMYGQEMGTDPRFRLKPSVRDAAIDENVVVPGAEAASFGSNGRNRETEKTGGCKILQVGALAALDKIQRLANILGYSTCLLPPCDPFILPPTMTRQHRKTARTEGEAYAHTSTGARADGNSPTRPCGLRAARYKEDRVRYLQEGPGTVYFTGQRDDHGQLIVKWGTSCLPRRQLEYEDCGGGGKPGCERVIRLGLIGQGYGRVQFEEPCSCGTSHREYHWMRPGGSLEEIEAIASECLAIIEEPTIIRPEFRKEKPSSPKAYSMEQKKIRDEALDSVPYIAGAIGNFHLVAGCRKDSAGMDVFNWTDSAGQQGSQLDVPIFLVDGAETSVRIGLVQLMEELAGRLALAKT